MGGSMQAAKAELAQDSVSDDVQGQALIRKITWRLMPLIIICFFFAFFDRINISFVKFQLESELVFGNSVYGLGASLFVVGYVIFEVPSNLMLYKVGARRWIARIMMSWGIATCAMVFVQTEWQFYVLRFLIGAMEAGFGPGVVFYLTLWFPSAFRGRATSHLFLASAFSGLIGAPLAGLLLEHMDNVFGLPGWHWLFLFGGVPCVVLGIVVLNVLCDRVEDAKWLTRAEKSWLAQKISEKNQSSSVEHSFRSALKSPILLLLGFLYFLIQLGSHGLNFWAPHLIRSTGVESSGTLGLLTAVPYVCGAIAMITVGRLSDRSGERRKFVAGLLLLASIGFLLAGFFDDDTTLLVIALGVLGGGVIASIPAFWALPPMILSGAAAAGGIALINTLGQFGGIVSPLMVSQIIEFTGSATPALYVISATSLLACLILMFMLPDKLKHKDL